MNKIKAFVPAAGIGSRLQPLTTYKAKPALSFLGIPTLYYPLWQVQKFGFEEVAINTHHLPETINSLAKANPMNIKIHLSHEDNILGTGGAHQRLKAWRADADLLVYNADVISNIDLDAFIELHQSQDFMASMVILPKMPKGKLGVLVEGKEIKSLRYSQSARVSASEKIGYGAAVYILSRDFLTSLPSEGSFDIVPHLEKGLQNGQRMGAFFHHGLWYDMGENLQAYWQNQIDVLKNAKTGALEAVGFNALAKIMKSVYSFQRFSLKNIQLDEPALIFGNAELPSQAKVGPNAIVCSGAKIGEQARLENCLVLENAQVQANEQISHVIVSEKLRIPLSI